MNNRRRILQFLGLGSLFGATAFVGVDGAGAGDLVAISGGWSARPEDVENLSGSKTFGKYVPTKWHYREVDTLWIRERTADIINRECEDGSEFVCKSNALLIFRKRVPVSA